MNGYHNRVMVQNEPFELDLYLLSIVKYFNTSVAQHFYPIKITTTSNALPSEVVSSRTVNSFKNSLDKHWAENPPNVRVNW